MISHALGAQRVEAGNSLDFFPTPGWASRALIAKISGNMSRGCSVLEPAAGGGHISQVLHETFNHVRATDIEWRYPHRYEVTGGKDFLSCFQEKKYDWVITNPPFNIAPAFVANALEIANEGVAMFVRTGFLESAHRYNLIYKNKSPTRVMPFSERVAIHKNGVYKNIFKGGKWRPATTATSYMWLVWYKGTTYNTVVDWIRPGVRDSFIFEDDFDPWPHDASGNPIDANNTQELRAAQDRYWMFNEVT